MEELQTVLAVMREFTSHATPGHDCWYCQIRHLKPILPWAAEETFRVCPWCASVGFGLNNGVIFTELRRHNNHSRNRTCYCVSHSCWKWNSDLHSLRNRHISHTWVMQLSFYPWWLCFYSGPTTGLLNAKEPSCFHNNINQQYITDLLKLILYLFLFTHVLSSPAVVTLGCHPPPHVWWSSGARSLGFSFPGEHAVTLWSR